MQKIILYSFMNMISIPEALFKSACHAQILEIWGAPIPSAGLVEKGFGDALDSNAHHLARSCCFPILGGIFLYFALQQESFARTGMNKASVAFASSSPFR